MPSPLSTGLSILQQGIEDMNKAREERLKAEAEGASNQGIMRELVNQGIWGDKEVAQFYKGNDRQRNEMIAGGARAFHLKSQVEDLQQRREAAVRAAETLKIQQAQEARAKAQFEYQPGADVYSAANAADLSVIPTGPGQPPHFAPYAHPAEVASEEQQAQARAANKTWLNSPKGPVLVDLPGTGRPTKDPTTGLWIGEDGKPLSEGLQTLIGDLEAERTKALQPQPTPAPGIATRAWQTIFGGGTPNAAQTAASAASPVARIQVAQGAGNALTPQDQEAFAWARNHPDDPRASAILAKLGIKQ